MHLHRGLLYTRSFPGARLRVLSWQSTRGALLPELPGERNHAPKVDHPHRLFPKSTRARNIENDVGETVTHEANAEPEALARDVDGVEVAGRDGPFGVEAVVRLPRRETEDGETDGNVEEVLRAMAEHTVPCRRDLDPVDERAQGDLEEVEDEESKACSLNVAQN